MILNLEEFIGRERASWLELESILTRLEDEVGMRLSLSEVRRLHYLYERTAADLAKIQTFSAEPETRRHLESLVARAYGEIHETRSRRTNFHVFRWFFDTFPRTFRRHLRAFGLALIVIVAGSIFGGLAVALDPYAKGVILPFPHLLGDPGERVAGEEAAENDRLAGGKSSFSAYLMTHNTKVAIFTLAMGMTFGVGTLILLFYNGIILGAVGVDYVLAGESAFLLGWLLPHGSVEIPSIVIAGQASLVLAGALLGQGRRRTLRQRLLDVRLDLVTLICGVAILLVWAGLIEAFFSQYHDPVLPYSLKISFGLLELALLVGFLCFCGRGSVE